MTRFACCLVLLLGATSANAGAIWIEVGDAGDISNPQSTVGTGNLDDIFGSIGGSDLVDVFAFRHTVPGGFFFIGSTLASGEHSTLTLYDSAKAVVTTNQDSIDLAPIPVGVYYIEIAVNGTPTQYELAYDGEARFLDAPARAPEPVTLSLFGLGFGALALRRRGASCRKQTAA